MKGMNDIFDNTNNLQYIESSLEELIEQTRIFRMEYMSLWDRFPVFYDNVDINGLYLGNLVTDGMTEAAVEHLRLNNSIIRWCVERGLDYACLEDLNVGEFSECMIVADGEIVEWYSTQWEEDLGYVSGGGAMDD